MKLTIKQLVESRNALMEFAQDKKLPARTSYWAAKVLRHAERELVSYEAARVKLLDSTGTLNEATRQYDFTAEGRAEFVAQYEELVATEIALPGDPLTLESLGAATISPASMMQLDWLITE